MNKNWSASVALVLVILGFLMCFIGITSNLGDANPNTPHAVIQAQERMYGSIFFVGACSLMISMWLAGYVYAEAKIRSIVVLALALATLLGLGVWMFTDV